MILIPTPHVAPLGVEVKAEHVQEVWDTFVKPDQNAGNPQSVEMRILMAILRAVSAGLKRPSITEDIEYAVEVPGRGFIGSFGGLLFELVDAQKAERGMELGTAKVVLHNTIQRYNAMGCPEIAETVRIVSRDITVARGAWEAVM